MTLRSLSIHHPKSKSLTGALAALGIECAVSKAPASIRVELETPRGIVVIR
jgi:hypothetical protein